jgi:hypothetical protein
LLSTEVGHFAYKVTFGIKYLVRDRAGINLLDRHLKLLQASTK